MEGRLTPHWRLQRDHGGEKSSCGLRAENPASQRPFSSGGDEGHKTAPRCLLVQLPKQKEPCLSCWGALLKTCPTNPPLVQRGQAGNNHGLQAGAPAGGAWCADPARCHLTVSGESQLTIFFLIPLTPTNPKCRIPKPLFTKFTTW